MISAPALEGLGVVDIGAASQLVAKARRLQGHIGEREEMALVGVLTLGQLAAPVRRGLPAPGERGPAGLRRRPLPRLRRSSGTIVPGRDPSRPSTMISPKPEPLPMSLPAG